MSFYHSHIFPWLLDRLMDRDPFYHERIEALRSVRGKVLEIGAGTGLNLAHYVNRADSVVALDVNAAMHPRARRRLRSTATPVSLMTGNAQQLPFPDRTFDSVVTTWTLCSIPDPLKALREIRRVLRPGGTYFFMEHGLSSEPNVRKWQHRLTPVFRTCGDGCHLNRDIQRLISRAGLKITQIDYYYLDKSPKFAGFMYRGQALPDVSFS
jgi:ubiquinone/menaquinone biosynthesis C-methylase UbiE